MTQSPLDFIAQPTRAGTLWILFLLGIHPVLLTPILQLPSFLPFKKTDSVSLPRSLLYIYATLSSEKTHSPPPKSFLHLEMIVPFSREWCAFVSTLKSSPFILGEDTKGGTSSQLLQDLGYADLSICQAQHTCLLQGLDIVVRLYEVSSSCHLDLIQVLAEM